MKKIYLIIVCMLLLVGCNDKKEEDISFIMKFESEKAMLVFNINDLNSTNIFIDKFKYDESKVGKYDVVLNLYYSSTCRHCHALIEWLESVKDDYPYLKVVKKEASKNMDEYKLILNKMNIKDNHVPLTIIGDSFYVGFANSKISFFDTLIKYYSTIESCDMVDAIINDKDIDNCKQINKK